VPIIIDITEAGALVPHWRPYRKDEDVQRVYDETLSVGCFQLAQSALENPYNDDLRDFQPNFQRREIQQLWNLEVIELESFLLWNRWWICDDLREDYLPGTDLWDPRVSYIVIRCSNEAKAYLMGAADFNHRSRVRIEEALADHGRAQTAPARLTKGSNYEAKLDAIKVKDEANRKANRKLSFDARARKLVEDGDAPSLSTAKKWLRDLDSRQH
jgi:hypothetical protein